MKKRIAVYAICKNEEHNVLGFLENVSSADEIVLVDTGSTDDTTALASGYVGDNLNLVLSSFDPFRFDTARNYALNSVSDNIDFCVWLDLDERLEDNWYNKLQSILCSSSKEVLALSMTMIFSRDSSGNILSEYYQTKAHSRHSYEWHYPCHEVLELKDRGTLFRRIATGITVEHFKQSDKDRDYLPLLRLGVQENPSDQRALYYLGREYFYKGDYKNAVITLTKSLSAIHNIWLRQTAEAHSLIAQAYEHLDNRVEAEQHYLRYVALNIDHAESWVTLSEFYYYSDQYLQGLSAALRAASISVKPKSYLIRDTSAWSWKPYDLAALCCSSLGMYDKAVFYGSSAFRLKPDDTRLKDNLNHYTESLKGD